MENTKRIQSEQSGKGPGCYLDNRQQVGEGGKRDASVSAPRTEKPQKKRGHYQTGQTCSKENLTHIEVEPRYEVLN
jgi:hypothetical protein